MGYRDELRRFMEPVTWFLTGMEKHSDAAIPEREGDCEGFWRAIRRSMASFSYGSLHTAMNQLDNHDHSRFITRTNGRTGRLESAGSAAAGEGIRMGVYRQAIVMQFTWPGAPTLYYGDETASPAGRIRTTAGPSPGTGVTGSWRSSAAI